MPTETAIFPQLANPANASVLNNSSGNLTSIGTLDFSSVNPSPTPYTILFGQGTAHFEVTGQGVVGPGQAAATLIVQPADILSFQNASTGGVATFVIRPGGILNLSNRNAAGLTTMTTGPMTNEGAINLGVANVVGNTLTVFGSYTGSTGSAPGLIRLNTYLGTDGSPSDRLIVSGGLMSGSTALGVTNVNGPGARTNGDGILVVQAVSGATSTTSAFSLSGRVAAGAYDYLLFRGGSAPGTANNWYLRSFLSGGGGGGDGDNGGADGGIPLYRPEVALQAAIPKISRAVVRATLGTFHDREGEQVYASGDGGFQAGWARVFGGSYNQRWRGTVMPTFRGNIVGLQVGLPVLGLEHASGEKDRAGLFFGYGTATTNVTGFADGVPGAPVGALTVNSYSAGAYWTHFWPAGGYLDAVFMYSSLNDTTNSVGNVSTANSGRMLTGSLELGYPIPISPSWAIEPQAQFIVQHWSEFSIRDSFSQISAATNNAFTGRFGARLVGNLVAEKAIIKPFALANLWHDFGDQDQVTFETTPINTNQNMTTIEVGGGVSASISRSLDAYAKVSYTTAIDGNYLNAVAGRLGLRVIW